MKTRQLGSSDLIVSEICLGTMTYGEQNSEKEAHEQLDCAWDHGVNCLDTAEIDAVAYTGRNSRHYYVKSPMAIAAWDLLSLQHY